MSGFSSAINRLQEALETEPTALNRDASIQRFEFVFELAWKVVQKALREEGLDCASPRSCMKAAYRQGWIHDEAAWLAILEDQNLTSHTYDETLAVAVYSRLAGHLIHFQRKSLSIALPTLGISVNRLIDFRDIDAPSTFASVVTQIKPMFPSIRHPLHL